MEPGERSIDYMDSFAISKNELIDDELDRVGRETREQLEIAIKNAVFCFNEFPDSEEIMYRDVDGKIIGMGIEVDREIN